MGSGVSPLELYEISPPAAAAHGARQTSQLQLLCCCCRHVELPCCPTIANCQPFTTTPPPLSSCFLVAELRYVAGRTRRESDTAVLFCFCCLKKTRFHHFSEQPSCSPTVVSSSVRLSSAEQRHRETPAAGNGRGPHTAGRTRHSRTGRARGHARPLAPPTATQSAPTRCARIPYMRVSCTMHQPAIPKSESALKRVHKS